MNNNQDAFKYNKARKNIILFGAVILIAITALSCVSSFLIYRLGFADMPYALQQILALFAVLVVEGAFAWLVYGFTRAFSSGTERLVSLVGIGFLVVVMLINLVTHFQMAKHIQLSAFQQAWIDWGAVSVFIVVLWGAVSVFIVVLLIVLFITLSDPVIRLIRLELRFKGKQEETILQAKAEALDSNQIASAMASRATFEAAQLAAKIEGESARASRPRLGYAARIQEDNESD